MKHNAEQEEKLAHSFLERELSAERFSMTTSEGSLGVSVLNGVEIDES